MAHYRCLAPSTFSILVISTLHNSPWRMPASAWEAEAALVSRHTLRLQCRTYHVQERVLGSALPHVSGEVLQRENAMCYRGIIRQWANRRGLVLATLRPDMEPHRNPNRNLLEEWWAGCQEWNTHSGKCVLHLGIVRLFLGYLPPKGACCAGAAPLIGVHDAPVLSSACGIVCPIQSERFHVCGCTLPKTIEVNYKAVPLWRPHPPAGSPCLPSAF